MSTLTAERTTAAPATGTKSPKRRLRGEAKLHPLVWVFVVAVMGFSLIPFYWLVNTSLKKGASLSQGELFPSQPTLENYLVVFQNPEFLLALRNSVIIAVVTTTVALVFASFAAYALARLKMRRKGMILTLILSVTTFPAIAIAGAACPPALSAFSAPITTSWRLPLEPSMMVTVLLSPAGTCLVVGFPA